MADGYARATGKVGVAIATSGPGATNMVTGLATAMMDSSPIVCITGQVGSRLIGSDAFQETDITGVTLPVTKHNYLVTRASDVAPAVREAFYLARSGRPGPVLIDITKDAQQSSATFDWEAAAPRPHGRPPLPPQDARVPRSARADQRRRAPGHPRRARPDSRQRHGRRSARWPSAAQIPVAMTLLGIGSFPASHALNLGMMGMHGEAWVNTAIQQADLLIALGMRFDDRVTGTLATYAPNAKKIHIEIDPAEINKNVRVDVGIVGDVRQVLDRLLPASRAGDRAPWLRAIDETRRGAPPSSTSRTCPTTGTSMPRTSSTICGARPTARRSS